MSVDSTYTQSRLLILHAVDIVEVIGFVSGGVAVWLTARQRISAWPVGLINVSAWGLLFLQSGLPADALLQVLYLALGIFGWWNWAHRGAGGQSGSIAVTRLTKRSTQTCALALIALAATLYWFDSHFTTTDVPLADAVTTAISLVAVYLAARKVLESWWLWIIVDLLYIALYTHKELYLTAALQPLFIVMCIVGYKGWRKSLEKQELPETGVAVPVSG